MTVHTWEDWSRRALARYPTPWAYLLDSSAYMAPVIGAVKAVAPPPRTLLEAGCGLGMMAMVFYAHGYQVTAIDHDGDVLTLADTMPWRALCGLHPHPGRPPFPMLHAEALTVAGAYDIAFSGGVIEHESVDLAVELLRAIKRVAPVQVVTIPGPLQLEAEGQTDMGEQPITLPELIRRCRGAGWTVVRAFGFGVPPTYLSEWDATPPQRWRVQQGNGEKALSFCVLGKDAG